MFSKASVINSQNVLKNAFQEIGNEGPKKHFSKFTKKKLSHKCPCNMSFHKIYDCWSKNALSLKNGLKIFYLKK